MALSISQKGKGRLRPDDPLDLDESSKFSSRSTTSSSSSTSSFSSSSESESESEPEHGADSSEDEDEDEVTQEYLDSLLEKARASIAEKAAKNTPAKDTSEEDVIRLDDLDSEFKCVFGPIFSYVSSSLFRGLPPLDPGTLPPSYITFGESPLDAPSAIRDLDVERVMESSSSRSVPAPPRPPPELTKSGKPLTKKEKKAVYHPISVGESRD
jgi:hypothetical protein